MPKIGVVIILAILFSTTVLGLNNRSAVSLSGLDSASCTVPDPCRTFDVAISKTNDGRSRSTNRSPSSRLRRITLRLRRPPAMRSPSM